MDVKTAETRPFLLLLFFWPGNEASNLPTAIVNVAQNTTDPLRTIA